MGSNRHPDTCNWCGKMFSVEDSEYNKDDLISKWGENLIILCPSCSPDVDQSRSFTSALEDGKIDVPHTPEAEAALVQELRERCSMLERHVASPRAVGALKKINYHSSWLLSCLSNTDEYDCNCGDSRNL